MMPDSESEAQAVTDDDWIDWPANSDPAELDEYCFPMHERKLKFKLDDV